MFVHYFTQFADYKEYETPVDFGTFEAVGHFPYEKAQIKSSKYNVCIPREVYFNIEDKLNREVGTSNKIVVVFRDKVNFGTEDFLIQFKDAYCKVGSLESIIGYGGRELKVK